MIENQRPQILKLRDGIVRRSRSLHALEPFYPYSNMRLGNHINIVCTITNTHCDCLLVMVSDHLNYLCFLLGAHSACQNNIRLFNEADKFWCDFVILENLEKSITADNHAHLLLDYVQVLFVLRDTNLLIDVCTSGPINKVLIDAVVKQMARVANIDSGLNLVSSQDP